MTTPTQLKTSTTTRASVRIVGLCHLRVIRRTQSSPCTGLLTWPVSFIERIRSVPSIPQVVIRRFLRTSASPTPVGAEAAPPETTRGFPGRDKHSRQSVTDDHGHERPGPPHLRPVQDARSLRHLLHYGQSLRTSRLALTTLRTFRSRSGTTRQYVGAVARKLRLERLEQLGVVNGCEYSGDINSRRTGEAVPTRSAVHHSARPVRGAHWRTTPALREEVSLPCRSKPDGRSRPPVP